MKAFWIGVKERIYAEPAAFVGLFQSVIGALIAFGLPITSMQSGALIMVFGSIVAIWVRAKVVPVKDSQEAVNTALTLPQFATVDDLKRALEAKQVREQL